MERKQFLIYATTATGLLPLLITQISCAPGSSGQGAGPDITPGGEEFKVTSSSDRFHRHDITILFADVETPAVGAKTYTSTGPLHTHDVILTLADFQTLKDGGEIVTTSSFDAGHTHTWAIRVPMG